ncbi:MAG TPA: AraC family transcriptional regulator [Micromonosporaceae bacterium]|jgi:AraC-like DNA-binding protein
MTLTTTVLGQPVATLDVPPSKELVVVLVDVDDFEVLRLARGDDWAAEQLGSVERALYGVDAASHVDRSVTFVAPDAWIVALGSEWGDGLGGAAFDYAERVRAAARAASEVTVSVGVSRAHGGATRMESALSEAVSGIERKLIDSGDRVTVFDVASRCDVSGQPERIEQELARAIRDSDVSGALQVLSAWIDRIAAIEGVTPEVLRRWVTAEVMYALDVSGRRRLSDGSVDWFDAFSRLSLDELMEMSDIHDRSYLILWLQRLLDRIVDVNTPTSAGRHVLALVENHIQQHHAEDLRLSTVAAEVYVSPYYISHLFQREMGTTFLKYLTGVRMQRARELLADSELPIEIVSIRVGYASSKRFRTLFKRTFKVTPTEYRVQHRHG